MPFFLPSRLVDLQYFRGEPGEAEAEYPNERDFAFFAVNFGYSKSQYGELTPKEKAFFYKAWEEKQVIEKTSMYDAVFKAVYNNFRKKGKKALSIFNKPNTQKADMEIIENNISVVKEVEQKEGKDWVKAIYETNGMKLPKRGGRKDG